MKNFLNNLEGLEISFEKEDYDYDEETGRRYSTYEENYYEIVSIVSTSAYVEVNDDNTVYFILEESDLKMTYNGRSIKGRGGLYIKMINGFAEEVEFTNEDGSFSKNICYKGKW